MEETTTIVVPTDSNYLHVGFNLGAEFLISFLIVALCFLIGTITLIKLLREDF